MKKISQFLIVLSFGLVAACDAGDDTQAQNQSVSDTKNKMAVTYTLHYGDVVILNYNITRKFLTGETNGDATINKVWSTNLPWLNDVWLPSAKFRIIDPDNPTSVEEVKTGDEIAFRSTLNNLYLTAESWDDDVSVNRTVLGPWEKWKIYAPSNVTEGNTVFLGSGTTGQVSLLSYWNKYLRPDAGDFAKAGGAFDSTLGVWYNTNAFSIKKQ